MAANYDSTVNAFYLAYYGRPADPAGLAYWSQALAQSSGDFGAIVDAFSTSAEAKAHFSSDDASDHISGIYEQLFGRAPDQAGLDYWAAAIRNGSVTLGDAAIQIMNGAQSSDAQVSTLRQAAAAQFTAQVAATGVAYDGSAAVEAARVLIAAVTPASSAADIKALVAASTSLVQTAHDNPAVIAALAKGGNLAGVLATTGGKAEPVAVVQALASIAKAAVHDSAGLNTLLKGGGVADLINSLPAGTTLQDVTKAVDSGGLAAGTVVAAPPVSAPAGTTPVIAPKIAFVGPDGHDLPTSTTLVANSIWYFIDIKGKPANATASFEVSNTGKADDWKAVAEDVALDDGTYYVRYTVKDAAGHSGTSNTLKLVMDRSQPWPTVQLSHDTGTTASDGLTSNGEVTVSGLHANETWTYSFDGKTWITGKANADGVGTIADTAAADGVRNLTVRTLETVKDGSAFTSTALHYTVDTSAPGQGLKLASTTHTDATHADVVFTYTGDLHIDKGEALFYRIDSNDWSRADHTIVDEVNKTVTFKDVDLTAGDAHIYLETKDGAGNVLDVHATIDGPLVAPTVELAYDSGTSATDHITNSGTIVISGLKTAPGTGWAYSSDNGSTWTTGPAPISSGQAFIDSPGDGEQTLLVRSIDAAGNVGPTTTFSYTLEWYIQAQFSVDGFGDKDEVTTDNKNLGFHVDLDGNHKNDLTTVYEISATGKDGDFAAWDAARALDDGTYYFRAHVTDPAGNDTVTNAVTVHIDNTKPAVPGVWLGVAHEGAGLHLYSDQNTNLYLTDAAGHAVQLQTSDPSGGVVATGPVTVAPQAAAVEGTIGAGPRADFHTNDTRSLYGFGTTGNDTLHGNQVMGFDGDDVITALGDAKSHKTFIYGGKGSDQIHTEAVSSQIIYASTQDSFVAADDTPAHGFDTVYVGTPTGTLFNQLFDFDGLSLSSDAYDVKAATPLTGHETGNELLALLNTSLTGTFKPTAGTHSATIDFGTGSDGQDVNFLVIDTDGDGKIGTSDYAIKIVGTVDLVGWGQGNGLVNVQTNPVPAA